MEEEDREENPEDDPSEGEPMEKEHPEEDPEKDPSEGEPMEEEDPEEDPEEDSEVSEGRLMGSEDQGEERREIIMQDDQIEGPESVGVEIDYDSTKRKGKAVTGMTCWKRGRCGRMCRGTCPLDASNQ